MQQKVARSHGCDTGQAIAFRGALPRRAVRKASSSHSAQHSSSTAAGPALPWSSLRQHLASSAQHRRGTVTCHTPSHETSKQQASDESSSDVPSSAAPLQAALAALEHTSIAAPVPAPAPSASAASGAAYQDPPSTSPPPITLHAPSPASGSPALSTPIVDKRNGALAAAVSQLEAPTAHTLPSRSQLANAVSAPAGASSAAAPPPAAPPAASIMPLSQPATVAASPTAASSPTTSATASAASAAVKPVPSSPTSPTPPPAHAATAAAAPAITASAANGAGITINIVPTTPNGNGNGVSSSSGASTIHKAAAALPPAPAIASGPGLPLPSAPNATTAPVSGSGTPSSSGGTNTHSSGSSKGSSSSPSSSPPTTPSKESKEHRDHKEPKEHKESSKEKSSKSSGSSSSPTSASSATQTSAQPQPQQSPIITSSASGFQLQPMHIVLFSLIFIGGALFATMTLQFTSDMKFTQAVHTVARRVAKSVAFRQLCVIACAILLVRFGLNNVLQALARFTSSPVQWDKSKLYYVVREVYQPLELLLFIAAICTLADSFVPQLIAVPKATVTHVVKCTLSVSFILGAATVIFNLKSRWCKENAWQGEMKGDVTSQRRWEAYDKLGTFIIYAMTFVLGIQAIGLEVTSVLAIGGIGGLAIGLAGREICENLLNGLIIMTTNPFEVGDEVHFFHTSKQVEGIVLDIGWYRTLIRSFEREVYVIPNAVFSKNIVLNISRKHREWRFHENISIRVQDVDKSSLIIQDIRRIVRNDPRVMNKLHRRIFLDKVSLDDARIYISFYCEASNREAFMTIKQDLLLAFIDCVERNGARLAVPRTVVDMDPEVSRSLGPFLNIVSKAMNDSRSSGPGQGERSTNLLGDGHTITAEASAISSSSKSKGGSGDGGNGSSSSGNGTGYSSGYVVNETSGKGSSAGGEGGEKRKSNSGKGGDGGGSSGGNGSSTTDAARLQPQLAYAGGGGVANNVVDAPGAATPVRPAAGDPNHPIVWALTKVASALFETPH